MNTQSSQVKSSQVTHVNGETVNIHNTPTRTEKREGQHLARGRLGDPAVNSPRLSFTTDKRSGIARRQTVGGEREVFTRQTGS